MVRRDNREARQIPVAELATAIPALLDEVQQNLFAKAQAMLDSKTATVDNYDEFKTRVAENAGWNMIRWCEDTGCETQIKEETKATSRNLPLDGQPDPGPCLVCGKETVGPRWIFARAY